LIESLRLPSRLPREGAREYAIRMLKYNIVRLHLPPGTMISAAELAESTGISRTPFREAMQELAKSDILTIYPQAGSQVSYIDYEKIHEARFIRMTLETTVIEQACERITPEACLDLEELLQLQENSLARGDSDTLLELDDRFHQYFFALAGKQYTYQIMEGVLVHFDRVRRLSLGALSELRIVADHRKVFEAVRAHDKTVAVRLLMDHLSRYLEDEKIIRATYPKFFREEG